MASGEPPNFQWGTHILRGDVAGNPYCAPQVGWVGITQPVFTAPPRLSDEDIERIARRVAELLKASGG